MIRLSASEVRRIAATAPFDTRATRPGDALTVLHALGALQLDPMSRVERAHRLTVLSRLPAPRAGRPGAPAEIDDALWRAGPAQVFEGNVHALCVLPVEAWPLWRERRERAGARLDADDALRDEWRRIAALVEASPNGRTLGELEREEARTSGWSYSRTKSAVEYAVDAGRLVVSERRGGLRVLDLPERRIPAERLDEVLDADEIDDVLVARALRVLGIGELPDLARHVRVPAPRTAAALERLVRADAAVPVSGDGAAPLWASPAALAALDGPAPSGVRWLGPFDNLMWDRDRVARVFGLEYRLEAYVPKALRVHGPYALVALVGDRMAGRIDLRADRRAGALEVHGWTPQPGRQPASRLRASLPRLARSLGLAEVRGSEAVSSG